jgi:hypothetical protein
MATTTARCAVAGCATLACVAALVISTGRADSASDSAITATQLRQSLARSGLQITHRVGRPRESAVDVVGGIARGAHGARVEFEFVVAKGRRASTRQLGTLDIRIRRLGPNQNRPEAVRLRSGTLVTPVIRGVLGNVAYALYYFGVREAPPEATFDVVRRLDRALFDAFPPTDPEAHAILERP